jgi:hypothetical protein
LEDRLDKTDERRQQLQEEGEEREHEISSRYA